MALRHQLTLWILASCVLPAAAHAVGVTPVEGVWATHNDKAVVRIYGCGAVECGSIIRLGNNQIPWPVTDAKNDNPALRSRPLIGLQIISNLGPESDHWKGVIYSPEDGRSYAATFSRLNNGALKVKGCWMFLCRTQIWNPAK
jgi:uncharacterized protein (DUF2147 family)